MRQEIKSGKKCLIFLDYDGTLVPIKRRPELAILHPKRRKILKSLGKKFFVSIVSGRSLRETKRLVRIDSLAYIGNHGLEICWRNKYWVHPLAERIRRTIGNVVRQLGIRTGDLQGVFIEDKGLTASVHYRLLAPQGWSKLKKLINEEVRIFKGLLKITKGKRVFELRPNVDWDKGRGVLKLIQWFDLEEAPIKIYIGDDRTDEDAFKALETIGLTILVGQKKDSSALFRLSDVQDVWSFLKSLSSLSLKN